MQPCILTLRIGVFESCLLFFVENIKQHATVFDFKQTSVKRSEIEFVDSQIKFLRKGRNRITETTLLLYRVSRQLANMLPF